jgi:hypothetical protein
MACLGRTGTGLFYWLSGRVLVYPADGVILVKKEKINTKFEYRNTKQYQKTNDINSKLAS